MATQLKEQHIRIVLVGKTGAGKSATGNTILGLDVFHKAVSSKSVTKHCTFFTNYIDGQTITVLDTPGWCDTELTEIEITEEVIKCIDLSYPGPHVFLLVVTIGRFTEEEKKTVQKIQEVFGDGATRYILILFTRGDELENSIDSYVRDASKDLKALVDKCGGRYHVFNNKDKKRNQVSTLLMKIETMVNNNGGYYSNTTYQLLKMFKEREANLQQEAKAVKMEMQAREAEFERRIQHMEYHQNRQKFRELELKEQLRQLEHKTTKEVAGMTSKVKQMQIEINKRIQEEKEQRALIEKLEEQKQKEKQLQLEDKRNWMETEGERQNLEQEREEINYRENYEAKIAALEEQQRLAEAEKEARLRSELKKKNVKCTIS